MASQPLQPAHEEAQSQLNSSENDNSITDTVFRVGNEGNTQDIHAVAALFAIRSPYFKRLLFGRMSEAQPSMDMDVDNSQSMSSTENFVPRPKRVVRIEDLSPAAFKFLKSLFYGTKPTLNKGIAANVTYAAKKYLLTILHNSSMDFISRLLPSDISGFLKVLNDLHIHGLKDECKDLLERNKKLWSSFITSPNFKLLPYVLIEAILRSNELCLTEEVLWDSCVLWAKYQFEKANSVSNPLDDESMENETEERKEGELPSPFFSFFVFFVFTFACELGR